MRFVTLCLLLSVLFGCVNSNKKADENNRNIHYISNKSPLKSQPYVALPLGTIKPKGMLLNMLLLQRDGLTGNFDEVYETVCGSRNGWLGGDGDGWERGPYWVDGLVGLAYILDDEKLKSKVQDWIEWSINNQREDGYFGPVPFSEKPEREHGLQRDKREDWWPKMVMLKVLQQYYTATNDDRVISLMTNYFKFMQNNLPEKPLDNWTYWGKRRGGDNLAIVYWLYNITGDKFLLDLSELIYSQTYEWADVFTDGRLNNTNPTEDLHCVNIGHGLKTPVVYYQQNPEPKYLDAVKTGLKSLQNVHGYVNGMFGADERLHGNDPTQGIELCTVIEMMYSFETNLPITGDVFYADYLEKLAYNVLPAQHNDDYTCRQYFQQTNQVKITRDTRNFFNNEDHRMVMGVLTGYPCCTSNMHQGWPKFIQNLWYATDDNGLAALVYGASEVKAKVADGKEVHFVEETNYPFDENISFTYKTSEAVEFPFHLRVPSWCENASIKVNGKDIGNCRTGEIKVIKRLWHKGDRVELTLPMEVKVSRWKEASIGIERGPLVYALPIKGRTSEKLSDDFPNPWYEVRAEEPWNYGLVLKKGAKADQWNFNVEKQVNAMPWNEKNAPVSISIKGKKLPDWKEYNHSAGRVPRSPVSVGGELEDLKLIPYGCTTLRIAQFPTLKK
jgi:DUF1680 family protein